MGSGFSGCLHAINPFRRARVAPELLGLLRGVWIVCLRAAALRCGVNLADGWSSRGGARPDARNRVGPGNLFCRRHVHELEILLYCACNVFSSDYGLFDSGGLGFGSQNIGFRI